MKKQLKIAMVFSSDTSKAGGVQEHVLLLQKSLQSRGHSIDLFGSKGNIFKFDNYTEIGTVFTVPTPNGNVGNILLSNKKKWLINKINSEYDICHLHEPYVPLLSWSIINSIKIPLITSFHSGWNENSPIRIVAHVIPLFRKKFSENVSGAIFITELVKKRWNGLCTNDVNSKIIGYGIEAKFSSIDHKPRKKVKLLFVARLVARKGLHYLLNVIAQDSELQNRIELDVVGDGPERALLEKYVDEHNLKKVVTFHGEIIGDSRIKYYQEADIFCAPYTDEGLGLTVLEAMGCGCTIVGFWNQAFEDFLATYPSKDLLPQHGDLPALKLAVNRAVNNEELRKGIKKWCLIEGKKYTWDAVAQRTEKQYFEAMNNRR